MCRSLAVTCKEENMPELDVRFRTTFYSAKISAEHIFIEDNSICIHVSKEDLQQWRENIGETIGD